MPDKKLFCSSPWLHIKIGYGGRYLPCRWMSDLDPVWGKLKMQRMSLLEYYSSDQMNQIRTKMLTDDKIINCSSCHYEDSFGKTSGRMRQLFRSRIDTGDTFASDYINSPHYEMFRHSEENNGQSTGHPYDLQVSLSNTCNNACIMCYPLFSSRLNQDYQKLTKISPELFKLTPINEYWADNPELVDKFIQYLKQLPSIDYLHLLGGETLYLESFYTICESLIESGSSKNIYLGTTTNLTHYSKRLENIVENFREFHIGLSIESISPLNDYIRYPSEITAVLTNLDRFLALRERVPTLHLSLRITPNIFTIFYIDELIQYMCDHDITGESCDILVHPSCMRIELMPDDLRIRAVEKLKKVIEKNQLIRGQVVDARNRKLIRAVISSVAFSYVDFLENMVLPDGSEKCRHDLVTFLNGFESLRDNSILDYAPEYESFLTAYGYKR